MGYPVEMINKETMLFSLVGENAIESKKEALFNDYFKEADLNAKMMPLNIRMDDIGFFIHGLKDSQIKAAYFQQEYWQKLYTLLEDMSEEAKLCGIVDTIEIRERHNIASLSQGAATISLIKPQDKRVALYGNTPTIKSILFHLTKVAPKEIILYDKIVENCIELMKMIPKTIPVDVQRVQQEPIMIKNCDIFIDGLQDKKWHYHDKIQTIVELTYHDSDNLTLNDIEKEIAKMKTEAWMNNG